MAAFYGRSDRIATPDLIKSAHLEFSPCAIRPSGISGEAIHITESFDPLLDLASVVQDTAVAVHEVFDGWSCKVSSRIPENRVVP